MKETKIYCNKAKILRETGLSILYIVSGLLILYGINYLVLQFQERIEVPTGLLLFVTLLFALILAIIYICRIVLIFLLAIFIYRSIVLAFIPFLVLSESGLRFFYILWYNKRRWEQINLIKFFRKEKTLQLEFKIERVPDSIDLDELKAEEIQIVLDSIKYKKEIIFFADKPIKPR